MASLRTVDDTREAGFKVAALEVGFVAAALEVGFAVVDLANATVEVLVLRDAGLRGEVRPMGCVLQSPG